MVEYTDCLNYEKTSEGFNCLAQIATEEGCPLRCDSYIRDEGDDAEDQMDEEG